MLLKIIFSYLISRSMRWINLCRINRIADHWSPPIGTRVELKYKQKEKETNFKIELLSMLFPYLLTSYFFCLLFQVSCSFWWTACVHLYIMNAILLRHGNHYRFIGESNKSIANAIELLVRDRLTSISK